MAELVRCPRCWKDLDSGSFMDKKGIKRKGCNLCREKSRKNSKGKQVCEECGKKARYNLPEEDRGIRCIKHILPGMVSLTSKEMLEKRFVKWVGEFGGKVVGNYKNTSTPVECLCSRGHKCSPQPNALLQGQGLCKTCAGADPEACKQRFLKRVEELGGKVIGEYRGNNTPVECLCPLGHTCAPKPSFANSSRNLGMCRACSKTDPVVSKENFIRRVEELEGKIIGEYKGSNIPVECLCPRGHKCAPTPNALRSGQGLCRSCSDRDPVISKENFLKRIAELGGKVIGEYKDSRTPIECLCSKGHKCFPRPTLIQQGQGPCSECNQSSGELMVSKACEDLKIDLVYQARHPSVRRLRYDFSCMIEGKICYIEFDGRQHFEYLSFFGTEEGFVQARQRDLVKTYACELAGTKLVRLDYTWALKSMEKFTEYLRTALYNDQLLVAESRLYADWIRDKPDRNTMEKYMIEEPEEEKAEPDAGLAETFADLGLS